MNDERWYEVWKQRHEHADVEEGFTDRVMIEVRAIERERAEHCTGIRWILERASGNRFAQMGLIGAGAVVGVLRVLSVVFALLAC